MPEKLSVLQRATKADVRLDPYPHIVIREALPADLYRQLAESFPRPSVIGVDEAKNNARWNHRAELVEADSRIPDLWKRFIAYHASEAFFHEISTLFFDGIHARYPKQFPSLDYMKSLRVGIRGKDSFRRKDMLMDAMISGNTPVKEANSVRSTHIDNGRKLYSGLFYMRRPEDDSVGGDLVISRFKPEYRSDAAKSALFKGAYVANDHAEEVETVRYQPNCLVLFINTIDSLHGVTVRQPTSHGRYFMNLVGEVVTRLYRSKDGHPNYVQLRRPMGEGMLPPVEVLLQRLKGNRGQVLTD